VAYNRYKYILRQAERLHSPARSCSFSVPKIITLVMALVFLATDPEVRVRFPAKPDFLRSSGSETGSSQPRDYN
jgi:hypothetical protein